MSLKIALPLAAALVAGALPFARSAENAAPAPAPPAVAAPVPAASAPEAPATVASTSAAAPAPGAAVVVAPPAAEGAVPDVQVHHLVVVGGAQQAGAKTLVIGGDQVEEVAEATTLNVVSEDGNTMTFTIRGDGDHAAGVVTAVAGAALAAPPAAAPAADPGLVPGVPVR